MTTKVAEKEKELKAKLIKEDEIDKSEGNYEPKMVNHSLDNHIEYTYKAYQLHPMQKRLRLAWTVFAFMLVIVWSVVYLNDGL